MARRPRRPRDEEEDPPEPDEEDDPLDDEEPEPKPRRRARRRASGARARRPGPVRRWQEPGGEEDEEEPDDEEDLLEAPARAPRRVPVFWRARDSLYFEPLVALAIIVLLVVGMFAYTQNWPPVYVVESQSMQHGHSDVLGLINAGDLVLAQKTSLGSIVPYVVGLATGYRTYGEYGDVLLYEPNGQSGTPIVHRSIVYLDWNPSTLRYSAPELNGLPCGNASDAVYATPNTPAPPGTSPGCATSNLVGSLLLYRIGWRSATVTIDLGASALGEHSGFVTMGDNNVQCNGASECAGLFDQMGSAIPQFSSLVRPQWIIGVARGMIPWFGAVKLLLDGNAGAVPTQSWQFLGLTLAGAILLAFGVHYALRAEGIETPLRREEEEERELERRSEEESIERPRSRHRWARSLRPWGRDTEEDEEEEPPRPVRRRSVAPARVPAGRRRGRPQPRVRRTEKRRGRSSRDEDL